MRGDYKQAEDQLLSILKRFPNNPSANEMLGDLAEEREDYAHAAEWYEMTLEIVPSSASIQRKLEEARSRVEKQQSKDTTAQLGLPDPSSRMPLVIGAMIIVVLALSVGAYYLGAKGAASEKPVLTAVPKINAIGDQTEQAPPRNEPATNRAPTPSVADGIPEESALLQELKAKATDAGAILSLTHDPRSGTVTITFARDGKDDTALAARLARDTFGTLDRFNSVTLRGVSEGKIAFVADASRSRFAETQMPEWKQQHPSDVDWITYVLQNVWPAAPSPPTGSETRPTGNAPTLGDSGSAGGQ